MLDKKLILFDSPDDGEDHSPYLTELLELQAEYVSKYIVKVEAPNLEGKHDDLSDALVRMVWCATVNCSKQNSFAGVSTPRGGVSRFGRQPMRRTKGGTHPDRQITNKRRR